MKKGFVVLIVISLFIPCIANATYHLNGLYVQSRVYENGNRVNRFYFECKDSNNNFPTEDVLGSFILTDPNGQPVDVKVSLSKYFETDGSYNASTGQWIWSEPYQYSGYSGKITNQLIIGTYHLKFTDKYNETSEKDYAVNQIVDLPIIPTSSYNIYMDQLGNLIWKWQVPDYIDPSLKTSSRAYVDYYDENKTLLGEIYISIPTQMGFLSLPKRILDQVLPVAKSFYLGTQIRTTDNNNRSYSTGIGN